MNMWKRLPGWVQVVLMLAISPVLSVLILGVSTLLFATSLVVRMFAWPLSVLGGFVNTVLGGGQK